MARQEAVIGKFIFEGECADANMVFDYLEAFPRSSEIGFRRRALIDGRYRTPLWMKSNWILPRGAATMPPVNNLVPMLALCV